MGGGMCTFFLINCLGSASVQKRSHLLLLLLSLRFPRFSLTLPLAHLCGCVFA